MFKNISGCTNSFQNSGHALIYPARSTDTGLPQQDPVPAFQDLPIRTDAERKEREEHRGHLQQHSGRTKPKQPEPLPHGRKRSVERLDRIRLDRHARGKKKEVLILDDILIRRSGHMMEGTSWLFYRSRSTAARSSPRANLSR